MDRPSALFAILGHMGWSLREATGALLVVASLGALGTGVVHLRDQEYVACLILVSTGLSIMRAGVELLRPTMGE